MSISATISRAGHRVNIENPVFSEDDVGGRTTSYQVDKQDVTCWVQTASSRIVTMFAGRNIQVSHIVYFDIDPGVVEGSRLLFDGKYMVVVGVENQAGLNRLWAVHVRESK